MLILDTRFRLSRFNLDIVGIAFFVLIINFFITILFGLEIKFFFFILQTYIEFLHQLNTWILWLNSMDSYRFFYLYIGVDIDLWLLGYCISSFILTLLFVLQLFRYCN